MREKIKIIIADDEELILKLLEKMIHFSELNLELVGTAKDGESLLALIEKERPGIVISDINMPRMDGLEVVRRTRELGIDSRFVIISGFQKFEYAYTALKYDVNDYLLKPVDDQELHQTLMHLVSIIRDESSEEDGWISAQKGMFIQHLAAGVFDKNVPSIDSINDRYRTSFHSGLYRYCQLKFDFNMENEPLIEEVTSLTHQSASVIESAVKELCYEIVTLDKPDGVMFVVNYAEDRGEEIRKVLKDIFNRNEIVVNRFDGVEITLCVGNEVALIRDLPKSLQYARFASWVRMVLGTNQILFSEELDNTQASDVRTQISECEKEMNKALAELNTEHMKHAINQYFLQSPSVLCSIEFMQSVRDWITEFSVKSAEINGNPDLADQYMGKIRNNLHNKKRLPAYRDSLIEDVIEIMKTVSENAQDKSVKPIRVACSYIEQNVNRKLSLEEISQVVNLNPVYFCNLFKKHTGKNYTEYVTEIKMEKAKEYLKNTSMNINEIADALGYADSRYFSKLFKKEVGIKPTSYRNLYG